MSLAHLALLRARKGITALLLLRASAMVALVFLHLLGLRRSFYRAELSAPRAVSVGFVM